MDSVRPAVPGKDYQEVRTASTSIPDGGVRFTLGFSSRGEALVVDSAATKGDSIPDESLEILDSDGKPEQVVPRVTGGNRAQIVNGILTDRFAVWKETESTTLDNDRWAFYSYNRTTHQTKRIAATPLPAHSPAPIAPGGTIPSLANDARVYYSAAGNTGRGPTSVSVYSVPVDGTAPARREWAGTGGSGQGNYVFWISEAGKSFDIRRRNVGDGTETTLFHSDDSNCAAVTAFAANAHGEAVAQLKCDNGPVLKVLGSRPMAVSDAAFGYVSMSSDFVWFASAQPDSSYIQYMLRLKDGALLRVGSGRQLGGEAALGGHYFGWTSFGKGGDGTAHVARIVTRP